MILANAAHVKNVPGRKTDVSDAEWLADLLAHGLIRASFVPDTPTQKQRTNRIRKGSRWLKATLVQCAWAATRKKDSYLHALFHRIRMRRGSKKAILAVAASMLTAIYHMLKNGTMYEDLGYNHFDTHAKDRQKNRLIKRLADMGYAVQLTALPA